MTGNNMTRAGCVALVACCCSLWTTPVLAQNSSTLADDSDSGDGLPWNTGTTPDDRARAEALFLTGNRRAEDNLTMLAIESYQAAADIWPHPVILFNLAMVELRAKRLDEAARHFERAIQYGAKPLADDDATGEARLEEGRNRLEDIISQLTELEVICPLPGTRVFLGDRPLPLQNGRFKGRVIIGAFTLVGIREGYEKDIHQVVLEPGQSVSYVLTPKQRVTTRRYSPWLPRGVLGLSIAASLVGGVFTRSAAASFRAFDEEISGPPGTPAQPVVEDLDLKRTRVMAERQRIIAGAAYLTAGVSLIAATALYLANQPRTELRAPVGIDRPVSIVPVLGRDRLGIQANLTF